MTRVAGSLAIVLAAGLVLGGITHLAMVLAMPMLAGNTAFHRHAAALSPGETRLLVAQQDGTDVPFADPAVAMAVCAFDITEGPLRVEAPMPEGFGSLSVHGRDGTVLYSVTDRTAVNGVVTLVVMTRQQHDEALAAGRSDEASPELRFVSPRLQGLVVVRALAPYPSSLPEARERAAAMECMSAND
ncbi:MAG: hypothetical protein DIU59_000105 [Pseudomonadota bacterium]|nr:MAG: hypothetical protein DIU59_00795 [Pseudomonadota bacterium]